MKNCLINPLAPPDKRPDRRPQNPIQNPVGNGAKKPAQNPAKDPIQNPIGNGPKNRPKKPAKKPAKNRPDDPHGQSVVIFAHNDDGHTDAMGRALRAQGIGVIVSSLTDCVLTGHRHGITVPGFQSLPRGAFVRGIGNGSLEQITFRLAVLHALEKAGVPVINPARAIERTVDKGLCSFLLHHAGLPIAPSWVCHNRNHAMAIANDSSANGHTLVCKPLFGSRGRNIVLLDTPQDLPDADAVAGIWYLQRFIDGRDDNGVYRDHRAFVIKGQCLAIMERRSRHWIVNVHRGGAGHKVATTPAESAIAVAAAAAVGADYAGVDLIIDRDGHIHLIEVNGIPAWSGLQACCGIDVAAAIAAHCAGRWQS